MTTKLNNQQPEQLNDSDKKQAKKLAKKKNMSPEDANHQKFIEKYGSVICSSIHRKLYGRAFYIADRSELEKFEEAGGHDWGCTGVCGNAARWTVFLQRRT